MKSDSDIIIIGAGMIGLTAACALAKATDLSIIVLDQKKINPFLNSAEKNPRVSAISLKSEKLLRDLKIWPLIPAEKISLYEKIHVWDEESGGFLDVSNRELSQSHLGHIVENDALISALLERLTHTSVRIIAPVSLLSLENTDTGMCIHTVEKKILHTKLLIAADGTQSWVRKNLEIDFSEKSYEQSAITAVVQTEKPHQKTAWQRFLKTGPLAFLPLSDPHQCSIVWSVTSEEANNLLQLSEEAFQLTLAEAFEYRLGEIQTVSERHAFPLWMRHTKHYTAPHLAFVGDAAHTLHPLAGLGANLGFLDVIALAEAIHTAVYKKRDFAAHYTLRRYERQRKSHNALAIVLMDGIKKIFSSQRPSVCGLRHVGLNITNQWVSLKKLFIHYP